MSARHAVCAGCSTKVYIHTREGRRRWRAHLAWHLSFVRPGFEAEYRGIEAARGAIALLTFARVVS